jgi:hypothetical protein
MTREGFFGINADEIHNIDKWAKGGVKVIGPNTSNGNLSVWHFDNAEAAEHFCKCNIPETGGCYLVVSMIAAYRREPLPVQKIAFGEE